MQREVHVFDHPLIQHKLSLLRMRETSSSQFRLLVREISLLMVYDVTRDLPTAEVTIHTPLESTTTRMLEGKKVVFVPILRAGLGILEGMLEIVPSARVGHIGLYREPTTLDSVEYYLKLPPDTNERHVIVVDPMLATGNSAVAAIHRLKEIGPRSIKFVCLLAAPEGLSNFHAEHPEVPVYTASVDRCLNEDGYILPGLGDAGDRLFGTK